MPAPQQRDVDAAGLVFESEVALQLHILGKGIVVAAHRGPSVIDGPPERQVQVFGPGPAAAVGQAHGAARVLSVEHGDFGSAGVVDFGVPQVAHVHLPVLAQAVGELGDVIRGRVLVGTEPFETHLASAEVVALPKGKAQQFLAVGAALQHALDPRAEVHRVADPVEAQVAVGTEKLHVVEVRNDRVENRQIVLVHRGNDAQHGSRTQRHVQRLRSETPPEARAGVHGRDRQQPIVVVGMIAKRLFHVVAGHHQGQGRIHVDRSRAVAGRQLRFEMDPGARSPLRMLEPARFHPQAPVHPGQHFRPPAMQSNLGQPHMRAKQPLHVRMHDLVSGHPEQDIHALASVDGRQLPAQVGLGLFPETPPDVLDIEIIGHPAAIGEQAPPVRQGRLHLQVDVVARAVAQLVLGQVAEFDPA